MDIKTTTTLTLSNKECNAYLQFYFINEWGQPVLYSDTNGRVPLTEQGWEKLIEKEKDYTIDEYFDDYVTNAIKRMIKSINLNINLDGISKITHTIKTPVQTPEFRAQTYCNLEINFHHKN